MTPSCGHPAAAHLPPSPPLDARARNLRRLAIMALEGGDRGHIGSTMSLMEIVRVLYDDILRFKADEPFWEGRDRFLLSKGHGCIALYAVLADKGFFPTQELSKFCRFDGILGGHPERGKVPGVEASTGALGHGLSMGVGMALAQRMKKSDRRVFVAMGDGEINEGSIWEAALAAGKHCLGQLCAIVDYNKIQSYGFTDEVQPLEPLVEKWKSFGFDAVDVDGHDTRALRAAFESVDPEADRPKAIICHTVKGKGVPFAENDPAWHHKSKLSADVIRDLYAALDEDGN